MTVYASAILGDIRRKKYDAMPLESIVADVRKSSKSILVGIERIENSLSRFAQFTRPEKNGSVRPLGLRNELEKLLALMREGQKLDAIEVQNGISPEVSVVANTGAIEEIFFSLFNNAYEAMHGKGKLYLEAIPDGSFVDIKVRDTGPGIPEENLPRIFESFFTTKPNTEAIGIGLSSAKQRAERLGGLIKARTQEAGGAEFNVRLKKAEHEEKPYASNLIGR